jgi:hypothetical protein
MSEKSVEKSVMPGRNGGTLKRGGNTTPGTGRPKNEIREAARRDFEAAMPLIAEVALNLEHPNWKTAIDTLVKVAGLQQIDQTSGDKPIEPGATVVIGKDVPLADVLASIKALKGE